MGEDLPILDKRVLATLTRDVGETSAAFLIESLKVEIRSSERQLLGFAESNNMPGLENQAHALKSAVRSFGAMRLGALCMALEASAKLENNGPEIEALLANFNSVATVTIAAFD